VHRLPALAPVAAGAAGVPGHAKVAASVKPAAHATASARGGPERHGKAAAAGGTLLVADTFKDRGPRFTG